MSDSEFLLSLLIGILVIANFAYRQLDQPFHVSTESPLRLIKSRIPSEIGSRNFVEAYIYYLCLLLFGYFLLCFSENFYNFVIKPEEAGAQFPFNNRSPTWPLTVALVIVGLSPNIPMIRDVEQLFRKLAQRSAGIPHNFESYFLKICDFSFTGLLSDDIYIKKDVLEKTNELSLVLRQSTMKYREAPRLERNILRFFILHYWSIAPESPIGWRTRTPLQLEKVDLQEKANEARNAFNQLYDEAKTAPWMPSVRDASAKSEAQFSNGEESEGEEQIDAVNEFANRIKHDVDKYIAPYLNDMDAAFCFLFSNDPRPHAKNFEKSRLSRENRYDDPMFRKVQEHLLPFNTQTTRNIMGLTIFIMAIAVMILLPLLQPIITGKLLEEALSQTNITKALRSSFGTAVLFGSALIAATAYRQLREEAGKFVRFEELRTFPFMQYVGVFVFAFCFTAIMQNCVWMLYAFENSKDFGQNILEYYQKSLWMVTAFSLVGSLFSCVFVAWLQRASEQARDNDIHDLFLKRLAQSLIIAFITAILTMVIFVVTDQGGYTNVLSQNGDSSRLTEVVLAFLATLFGLISAAWQFRSLDKQKEVS